MRKDIGQLADEMNEAWAQVEERLVERYCVEARVRLPACDGDLCWGRSASGWGLLAIDLTGNRGPLTRASVAVRIAAVEALPGLVSKLEEAQQQTVQGLRDGTAALRRFVASEPSPG